MSAGDDRPHGAFGNGEDRNDPVVLVVGNVTAWTADGNSLPQAAQLVFAEIDEITSIFLTDTKPDIVLSSIFTPEFDALDLAQALNDAGFRGRYRALAPRLPNPGLIRREIRALCSNLDFDLLIIDKNTNLRPN